MKYGAKKLGMKYDRMLFGMKVARQLRTCCYDIFKPVSDAYCLAKGPQSEVSHARLQSNLIDGDTQNVDDCLIKVAIDS